MKCVCSEPKLLAGWWLCKVIEMLTGREKLLDFMYTRGVFCAMIFESLNLQAFFRYYLFMWETMSDVLGPGTSEKQDLGFRWEGVFHPLCWTHGFSHSEIATVWVCSSPGLIGNFCPVEFIGLIWEKKKKRRWWALNRCFKISMIQ